MTVVMGPGNPCALRERFIESPSQANRLKLELGNNNKPKSGGFHMKTRDSGLVFYSVHLIPIRIQMIGIYSVNPGLMSSEICSDTVPTPRVFIKEVPLRLVYSFWYLLKHLPQMVGSELIRGSDSAFRGLATASVSDQLGIAPVSQVGRVKSNLFFAENQTAARLRFTQSWPSEKINPHRYYQLQQSWANVCKT